MKGKQFPVFPYSVGAYNPYYTPMVSNHEIIITKQMDLPVILDLEIIRLTHHLKQMTNENQALKDQLVNIHQQQIKAQNKYIEEFDNYTRTKK